MANSKLLGKKIAKRRADKGYTVEEFAKRVGTSVSNVNDWESGSKLPSQSFLMNIKKALDLGSAEFDELKSLAEPGIPVGIRSQEITLSKDWQLVGRSIFPPGIEIATSDSITRRDPEMAKEIQELKVITQQLKAMMKKEPVEKASDNNEIIESIEKVSDRLTQITSSPNPPNGIYAPVIVPAPEDLQVRLVSSTALERFEEYRAEESKWLGWLGIVSGALLGIIINWATGGILSGESIVLLVVFAVICIIFGITALKYKKRGDEIRAQIFKNRAAEVGNSLQQDRGTSSINHESGE